MYIYVIYKATSNIFALWQKMQFAVFQLGQLQHLILEVSVIRRHSWRHQVWPHGSGWKPLQHQHTNMIQHVPVSERCLVHQSSLDQRKQINFVGSSGDHKYMLTHLCSSSNAKITLDLACKLINQINPSSTFHCLALTHGLKSRKSISCLVEICRAPKKLESDLWNLVIWII